ncbi:MAG: hypothetical protein HY870_18560 [Chloroflexi bacterium]|nr:hypothetical protein [Chloroflexota bacterium]
MAGISGQYVGPRLKPVKSSEASYDVEAARRMWDISEELTSLRSNGSTDRVTTLVIKADRAAMGV